VPAPTNLLLNQHADAHANVDSHQNSHQYRDASRHQYAH
jgi:hypothetical protein